MLIPGTAMFEACCAAASVLLDAPLSGATALHSLSIAEPLVMPVQAALLLEAAVSSRDGSVQLQSLAAGRSRSRAAGTKQHCSGFISRVSATGAAAQASEASAETQWHSPTLHRLVAAGAGPAVRAARQRASAVAAIWVPHAAQQNGYALHPAAADAVLHLSGAFSANGAALRVPVGMGALAISASRGHSFCAHPAAAPNGSPDGSGPADMALSYRLLGAAQLPTFELSNLLIREMKAPAAAAAASAAAASPEPSPEFLYSIHWQAERLEQQEVQGSLVADGQLHTLGPWAAADSAVQYNAGVPGTAACAAAVEGLQLMQQRLPSLARGSLDLAVRGAPSAVCTPGRTSAAASAAAASLRALAKVAGMEFGAVQLRTSELDAAAASGAAAPAAVDAFGTAGSAGAVLRAKLLRQPHTPTPSNSHLMPMPRGSLADLKLVPHTQVAPAPGEIQVGWG